MFYAFAKRVMWLGMHLLFRIRVSGTENIPKEGGFILCTNHLHALDPVMLAIVIKRRLRFMAKKELFAKRFIAFFLGALGAFPVDRGATDMRSYKRAIEIVTAGDGLLVFSQGTRMQDFSQAKNGAAMFALKTGAPILPAGIKGRYTFFSEVSIRFGEAVSMEPYRERKIRSELVEEVMSSVVTAIKELTA